MKQDVNPAGGQEGEAAAAKKWSATPPRARRPSLPSRRSGRRRGPARADDDPHLSQTTGATNHNKRIGAWSAAGVYVSWGVGWGVWCVGHPPPSSQAERGCYFYFPLLRGAVSTPHIAPLSGVCAWLLLSRLLAPFPRFHWRVRHEAVWRVHEVYFKQLEKPATATGRAPCLISEMLLREYVAL